jgi:D-tyrosyl-tRNA(Tyr) deacylase
MRAVVQRVTHAQVEVSGEVVGSIGPGLCVLVGVTHTDTPEIAGSLAAKLVGLRVFADDDGRMNRSLVEVGGEALVVSQFTLYGDTRKGRRPSYVAAAAGDVAEPLVDAVVDALRGHGVRTATGRFGADMAVRLTNDGPVTLVLDLPA